MQKAGIFQPPDERDRLSAIGTLAGYPIKVKKTIQAIIPFFDPIPQPKEGDWLWDHDEDGQSFDTYEGSRKNKINLEKEIIYIQPLELDIDKDFLKLLKKLLSAYYLGVKFKIRKAINIYNREITTRISESTKKIQYHGPSIMNAIQKDLPKDAYAMMCILFQDIYNKVEDDDYGIIYGLATKHNRIGVFSFIRFQEKFYEDFANEKRRISEGRFKLLSCKVMIHEIGHLFGMKHCTFYNCVLNGCNSYEEFDSKPIYMCPVCIRKLQSNIGFNFLERCEAINNALKEIGEDLGEYSKFYEKVIEAIKIAYGNHY